MEKDENMSNLGNAEQNWDMNKININGRFYKQWDMLIIYDNFLQLPFHYINGKRKDMDRGTFNDYADEITAKDSIDALFTGQIKQEYIDTLKTTHEKFKKTIASLSNDDKIDELQKEL